jgi:hypothetical protein
MDSSFTLPTFPTSCHFDFGFDAGLNPATTTTTNATNATGLFDISFDHEVSAPAEPSAKRSKASDGSKKYPCPHCQRV